jgi:hypothetical protein
MGPHLRQGKPALRKPSLLGPYVRIGGFEALVTPEAATLLVLLRTLFGARKIWILLHAKIQHYVGKPKPGQR